MNPCIRTACGIGLEDTAESIEDKKQLVLLKRLKGIEPEGLYISKSVLAGKTEALLAGTITRRQININR